MAHHSQDPFDGMSLELRKLLEDQVGATGGYPQGKLTKNDQGELRLAVGVEKGKVVLAFGTDVSWIGFDAEQARSIAEMLCKNAESIDGIESHVRRVAFTRKIG